MTETITTTGAPIGKTEFSTMAEAKAFAREVERACSGRRIFAEGHVGHGTGSLVIVIAATDAEGRHKRFDELATRAAVWEVVASL